MVDLFMGIFVFYCVRKELTKYILIGLREIIILSILDNE